MLCYLQINGWVYNAFRELLCRGIVIIAYSQAASNVYAKYLLMYKDTCMHTYGIHAYTHIYMHAHVLHTNIHVGPYTIKYNVGHGGALVETRPFDQRSW